MLSEALAVPDTAEPGVTPREGQCHAVLREAKRPVILAGGGVAYAGAAEQLVRFAELSGVPVLTNNKSRGALPTDHPLWARGFGTIAAAAGRGAGAPDAAGAEEPVREKGLIKGGAL